jgi:ribosomal protein S18 acetylase RimI-like enzyme
MKVKDWCTEQMEANRQLSEIVIVPMTPADYDDVHALWLTIRGFGIRALDDSREDIERFIARNPTTSVVARDGNRIVGSILCGSDGRQGALYHVCVAKEYRRRGIGTQMVAFCMHQLRYMGINKVSLIAFTTNEAGNAFWNKIGWTKKTNVNYYEFELNEKNITRFIEGDD